MIRYFALSLVLVMVGTMQASAQDDGGFRVQGRLVNPYAIEDLTGIGEAQDRTEIGYCPVKAKYAKNYQCRAGRDGFFGYEEKPGEGMAPPYFEYKVVGTLPSGAKLVESRTGGGGTGHFSNVTAIKADERGMTLEKNYAGGDRCNGGITEATVEGGKAVYSYNVTPADIINHFLGEEKYRAYDDLDACAVCCAGEFEETDGDLTALIFNRENWQGDSAPGNAEKPYQACFDQFVIEYLGVKEHPSRLDRNAAKQFAQAFDKVCGALTPLTPSSP